MRPGWLFVLALVASGTQCNFPEYSFAPAETGGEGGEGGGAGAGTAGSAGTEAGTSAGGEPATGGGGASGGGAAGEGGGGGGGGQPPIPPALCLEGPSANCECRTLTNGRVYELCNVSSTRDVAQVFCEEDGGTLVRMDDGTENGLVTLAMTEVLTFPGRVAWLQAKDVEPDGDWTWNDGTVLFSGGLTPAGQYSNWGSGEPNGNGFCTLLRTDGSWDDVSCGESYRFVCEQVEP